MKTKIHSADDLNAMISAIKKSGLFTIAKDSETCIATHIRSGKEVLRSIRSPAGWMTRHHSKLFTA